MSNTTTDNNGKKKAVLPPDVKKGLETKIKEKEAQVRDKQVIRK